MHPRRDFLLFAKVIFIAGLTLFLFSKTSNAATHYVSPAGSATWANSTNISTPCAITTAFANAIAGDLVYFRGGNYYFPQSTNYETPPSGYSIANSGTSGNPITFKAYTGEIPNFVGYRGWSGNEQVLMLSNNSRTNLTFDGFSFEAFSGANGTGTRFTPEIVLFSASDVALNIIIQNCTFTGTTISLQDNHHMIWIGGPAGYYSSYVTIRNCLFKDMIAASSNSDFHGVAAIMPYGYPPISHHVTIQNNEFRNCSVGIYFKGSSNPPATYFNISNNFFNRVEAAVAFNPNGGDYHSIYNNIIVLSRVSGSSSRILAGVDFDGYQGTPSTGNQFYNNTIYSTDNVSNGSGGLVGHAATTQIYNNIIKLGNLGGIEKTGVAYFYSNSSLTYLNNNNFGNSPFSFHVISTDYSTISTLQAANILVNTSNPCFSRQPCNNIAASPVFTNGSGLLNTPLDFLLTVASPGYRAGSDGKDMGANVTLVGPTPGAIGDPPPSSPKNFLIMGN